MQSKQQDASEATESHKYMPTRSTNGNGAVESKDNSAFTKLADEVSTIFHGCCLDVMRSSVGDGQADLIFADPPYNLGKTFGASLDKWPSEEAYAGWCYAWLEICLQKLKPSGSLYVMTSTQAMPL